MWVVCKHDSSIAMTLLFGQAAHAADDNGNSLQPPAIKLIHTQG